MDLNEFFFLEEEEIEPEYPFIEWENIKIRLLNKHHSLWGEKLAEAAKITSDIILRKKYNVDVTNKRILELGAGAGLPSICCSLMNSKKIISTDYPDNDLINNLKFNLLNYSNCIVLGYKWGEDINEILINNNLKKFDILILSDVIFNTNQHFQLLKNIKELMKINGFALVIHTHHRTNKVKEENEFFNLAKNEFNFKIEFITTINHQPMFNDYWANSPEEIKLRTTAYVNKITF